MWLNQGRDKPDLWACEYCSCTECTVKATYRGTIFLECSVCHLEEKIGILI